MKKLQTLLLLLSLSILLGSFTSLQPDKRGLKAVLIVGPQEDNTSSAIRKMNKIKDFLEDKGVTVERFYNKKTDWPSIAKAAKGAHFFIYSGHGSQLGANKTSGGLCLNNMISVETMSQDLQLAKNAMVIFQSVCRGAGSSADDDGDIGLKEAHKRVANYAHPFFDLGAGAYYANNLEDGCLDFLKLFWTGKNIKACFEKTAETWTSVELDKKYNYDKNKQIGIASSDWGGTATRTTYINGKKKVEKIKAPKQYDIAYVADPEFSLEQMKD